MTKKTAKQNVRILSEKEYREAKSLCNAYERAWRAKHPKEHKKESQALIKAIRARK